MIYSKKYNLQPGDGIVEPLFQTGLTKHHALYLGWDNNGVEWIAENHKFKNVQIIRASQYFAAVKRIDRIEKFNCSKEERKQIIRCALHLAGKPYDLVNYNCEHFVTEAVTGKSRSRQVENVFATLLIVFVASLFIE